MASLRQRIVVGLTALGVFVVALSSLTVYELYRFKKGIATEEAVFALVDAVMEMRRFEKNYVLYQDERDLAQNSEYLEQVERAVREHAEALALASEPQLAAQLRQNLETYGELMARYAALDRADAEAVAAQETLLRAVGKGVTALAQRLAEQRRQALHRAMDANQAMVLLAMGGGVLAMLAAGVMLYRSVTRPLAAIQEKVEGVAGGRLSRIDLPTADREIKSLVDAFNHVLGELELRQQQMLVSEKLASLGVLLSGVAHELNNPLSNISSSCQILLEEIGTAEPEFLHDQLSQIDEQTERARRIVASLLDFSRHQRFMKEPVALLPLVEETLAFVRGHTATGVTISVDVPQSLDVSADRQRLQQVLLNLIKNAAEAAAPVGHVAVRAWAEADEAAIEVTDDGCGIGPAELPHIFDPFFTTKDIGKGSGLGLFIVHDVVKKHGGRISVDSTPGQGTRFLIALPDGGKKEAAAVRDKGA